MWAVAVVAAGSTTSKRIYRGGYRGFAYDRDKPKSHSGKGRFEERMITAGKERMCSCVKHSPHGCARLATRELKDDDGYWHPYCPACLPECYKGGALITGTNTRAPGCCVCSCRGCLGRKKTSRPIKRSREPPTPPTPVLPPGDRGTE